MSADTSIRRLGRLIADGNDLSAQGPNFHISIEDFRKDKLSTLTTRDLVVFIGNFEGRDELVEKCHGHGARTAQLSSPRLTNHQPLG